ncbi:hypothetical protein HHK36_033208 [Tetracentron sinense]|uniref:Uncharacterized protein n=1 Tax=Tetracentron sinense TaxID=13715 RepID=A0A835CYW9_TETSI|nr:hypothetical protein HHK36_033208 [Tetracentron sinense]
MDNSRMVDRCSSCRGVAFEIKGNNPRSSVNAPPAPPENERSGRWIWLPWNQKISFDAFPLALERSMSRPSSHFCDLEFADDNKELQDLEEYEGQDQSENQKPVDDIEKQNQPLKVAKQRDSRLSILLLDQGLFTVYKCLFFACLTLNVIGLLLAATGHFPYANRKASLFSIGNILALSLCRSEAFLRIVFWVTVKLLGRPWVPLPLKTATTSFLQCLGGIHSGCGVSSIVWLVYALILTIANKENTSQEIINVAFTILSLLCISSLAAFPLVRHLHHNVFERTHRFAGWTALILLWVFIVLTICYEPIHETYDFRVSKLVNKQEFWLTVAITILIILPWVTVRRVPVEITAASTHAAIIKFEGGVQAGILGRISPSPLSEWHAFGIISDGKEEHMMLAGAVGDFTKSLVSNPPSNLWVRQVHFAGLPYLVNLYERVVVVATGSGICVFLSFLLQPCPADVCLVWVAKGIEQNFGKGIKEMMSGFPKDKVIIHDTAISGRPNVAEMSVTAAMNWRAQVVIVTSNPEGSRDVVSACKAAGIPAFGPIWDS